MAKTVRFNIIFAFVFFSFCLPAAWPVSAGEVDILIDKLVEKGVLSRSDAEDILSETKKEAEKEREETVRRTVEAIKSGGSEITIFDVPEWVQKTTVKGDLRLRYQYTNRSSKHDRHRGRYRLRIGIVTELSDVLHVGFGLATGGGDPRSTNQTMDDSFETPDIRLDYAYAAYTPFCWLTVLGGKFKNPLWGPSDLLWDSDIRPEGVSVLLHYRKGLADMFMNAGLWLLDEESGDEQDPVMAVVQSGVNLHITDDIYLKNAVSYYEFRHVEKSVLDYSAETNTRDRNGNLLNDYDAVSVSAELGIKNPFRYVPFMSIYGDYVKNITLGNEDDGHLIGCKIGHKKVRNKYEWQLKAMYRRLERDAWLDILPDSDAYGGETNAHGYEFVLTYGLYHNVTLGVDYYYMEKIRGASTSENLLQVDLVFKY